MKNKLFRTIIATIILTFSLNFFNTTASVYANNEVCGNNNIPEEVRKANGCPETGVNSNDLKSTIENILNGIIAVSGLVAVIFVVIGGINYITSSGDTNKLEKAKKTILYACIGLAICAIAFAIVNFVIVKIIGS